jgi:hypothetical protein
VGTRSSQPSGAIIESSRCSSACSAICDWMKIIAWFGSMPAASQSMTMSQQFFCTSPGAS